MDISNNDIFYQVSQNLQTVIDFNTARYREYQRQSNSHINMGSRYVNYLMQNILLESVLIFLSYLMHDTRSQPSSTNVPLVEERQHQVPIQNPTLTRERIPRNTFISDYFLSYTIDPLFNNTRSNHASLTLTDEEINRATEHILYDPSGNQSECPITLERFQPEEQVCRIIPCGHIFKETSIRTWFRRNVRCPVCRYDIRDYRPENIHEEDEDEYADLPDLIDDPNPSFIETRYNIYDLSLNSQRTGRTGFLNRANTSNIRTYINNFNHRIQENQPIVNEIVNNIINNQIDEPAVNELVTSFMDIFRQTR